MKNSEEGTFSSFAAHVILTGWGAEEEEEEEDDAVCPSEMGENTIMIVTKYVNQAGRIYPSLLTHKVDVFLFHMTLTLCP